MCIVIIELSKNINNINNIIPALEFKSLKSGIDLNKPLVLVMSPTAAAAKHLLYGDTIHGSLRMTSFQSLEKQMLHGANAKLSSELCQVKYVIIDEISMVGSEFLWDINHRLKQIMGSDKYFGGLNVIATGDFHQLAPIKKSWIFQQTRIHGRANNTATNIWKVLFKMYKLEQHNRSANDPKYSELQEQISIGIVTESMMQELQKRVEAVCDTEDKNEWYRDGKQIMITATHDVKDKFNVHQLNLLEGELIQIPATDISSKRNEQLPDFTNLAENKTKGLKSILHIKNECPIKLTLNINKKDSLVNGTFGYVLNYDAELDIIWCIFSGDTGTYTRQNSEIKHPTNSNAVPIVKVSEIITLQFEGTKFKFKRTQFPMVLAYAITSHSAQGITKERVIIDYGSNKAQHALFSVPFSRAQTLNGIFLKKIERKYVHCDYRVLEEYDRLESRATYKFDNTYLYDPCFYNSVTEKESVEEMKVIYLNMKGLDNIDRFNCLRNDINLMSADVICISNTKTSSSDNLSVMLKDFKIIYNTHGVDNDKSMGMIIYKKQEIEIMSVESYNDTYYESVICEFKEGYICFICADEDIMAFDGAEVMEKLKDYSVHSSILSIIGGLKSDSIDNNEKSVKFFNFVNKLGVKSRRRTQLSNEIDFIFVKEGLQSSRYATGIFNNLYTDHSAMFMRFSSDTNDVFHLASSEDINTYQLGVNTPFTQDIVTTQLEVNTPFTQHTPQTQHIEDRNEDIYKFDNSHRQNNCWLNSVLQVLLHLVKSVPNEDYQYTDVKIQAFMNYLKDPTMKKNRKKLCVNDNNIIIPGELDKVSVKKLFTMIIKKESWNSSQQQDSSEALVDILNCFKEEGNNGPFNFCQFTSNLRLTCTSCHQIGYSGESIQNVMIVVIRGEERGDMREALINRLKYFNDVRECPNCKHKGMTENLQFIQTGQFFHLQIASIGEIPCIPLQDFEITLSSGIVKKYELECIIQRSGSTANNGHYWSNIKKMAHGMKQMTRL